MAAICVKAGAVGLLMVMLIVVPVAHWLLFGVNVYSNVPIAPVLIDDGFHEGPSSQNITRLRSAADLDFIRWLFAAQNQNSLHRGRA